MSRRPKSIAQSALLYAERALKELQKHPEPMREVKLALAMAYMDGANAHEGRVSAPSATAPRQRELE